MDYDLTIKAVGTFAVTVTPEGTRVGSRPRPRPRGTTDFHLTADALTLAELLAGVDHRIGRLRGPARFTGSRKKLRLLRALADVQLSLAGAARANADLAPADVYRALAYAVHPGWTRGHRFTVAQEIDGEPHHLTALDGAGLAYAASPPAPPDATVAMTRETFGRLLKGEPVPSGERPSIRGDRAAVAHLKGWMDRARQQP
jgi:hypothetical protein